MFLHTYTFATNQIPLVLEELSFCRNLHQIQVERTKKAPLRKEQKQRGERSQPENKTWANPPQHRGLDLAGSPQREGEDGPGHPRHGRAKGTATPIPLLPRPTSC
jgi:hypothetical protein